MNLIQFLSGHAARLGPEVGKSSFFSADQFPLDDEEIADVAVNAMLLIMNNSQRKSAAANHRPGCELRIEDYVPLVSYGVRFPWKERISFSSHVDLTNDELPGCAVIGLTRHDRGTFAQAAYATSWAAPSSRVASALVGAKKIYRVGIVSGYNPLSRNHVNGKSTDIESVVTPGWAGVMPDGLCIGCTDRGSIYHWGAQVLSYVVGLHNDKKYFWEVTASEEYLDGAPAKAMFSIDEEYVKSLFYARSVPMTGSGRLRPILHWVNSHKRRMREGVEVDIRKHLRGIESFVMHGVGFSISEPVKKQLSRKAA